MAVELRSDPLGSSPDTQLDLGMRPQERKGKNGKKVAGREGKRRDATFLQTATSLCLKLYLKSKVALNLIKLFEMKSKYGYNDINCTLFACALPNRLNAIKQSWDSLVKFLINYN